MSNFGRDERVQESGVVGHSHDSDDRIEDLDIYEALVNPHDAEGGAKKGGGAGGPGMMPMGGGAGGGSGHAGTTAGGTAAGSTGPSRGTTAAGAGTGASGVGAPGFAGAGSGAGGVSGLGGSGSGGLGGLSAGVLSGNGPGSGASNFSMPTLGTRAAGVTDPSTTGFEVPPYTGTTPGGDVLPSPGTNPGAGGLPSVPGSGPGSGSWTLPTTPNPSTGGVKPVIPSIGGGGMPSVGGAGSGAGGAGGVPGSGSLAVAPVQASPEMLHKEAQHWDDTAREFGAVVVNPVNALAPSSVDFGMMVAAFAPYSDLVNRMKKWSSEAGAEFASISDALQSASGDYQDTEATNASESRTIPAGSSTVAV